MISTGVDVLEIERLARAVSRWGHRFLAHVYTDAEVALCRGRVPDLAVRFAGKEAISKALGTGLVGVSWREMEILVDPRGKPLVKLHGRAAQRASRLGLEEFAISLSHSRDSALAFVVACGDDQGKSRAAPQPGAIPAPSGEPVATDERVDVVDHGQKQVSEEERRQAGNMSQLIVHVKGDLGPAVRRAVELKATVVRELHLINSLVISALPDTAIEILKEPWVESVEQDRLVYTQTKTPEGSRDDRR
jgi:holo-[acyl-carrier protein] synthase